MKAVAETLGVSRSQLVCRVSGSARRRGRYTKADDAWLLPTAPTPPGRWTKA